MLVRCLELQGGSQDAILSDAWAVDGVRAGNWVDRFDDRLATLCWRSFILDPILNAYRPCLSAWTETGPESARPVLDAAPLVRSLTISIVIVQPPYFHLHHRFHYHEPSNFFSDETTTSIQLSASTYSLPGSGSLPMHNSHRHATHSHERRD